MLHPRGAGSAPQARGAHDLGEVLGAASNADAHHITAPSPGGAGAVACMRAGAGRRRPAAGATSRRSTRTARRRRSTTPPRPRRWPRCSATPGPPMTSTKGVTGHALGAAGAHRGGGRAAVDRAPLIPPTARTTRPTTSMTIDLVHRRAAPVGAGPVDLEQLRLRRPQRHPGDRPRVTRPFGQNLNCSGLVTAGCPPA